MVGILGAYFAYRGWRRTVRLNKELEAKTIRIREALLEDLRQERQRQNERVRIVLQEWVDDGSLRKKGRVRLMPVALRRADLTRAEVQGIIGLLPIARDISEKQPRFRLEYLATPEYHERLSDIFQGSGEAALTIDCSATEFDQFVQNQ
jgi:hypothetical protein